MLMYVIYEVRDRLCSKASGFKGIRVKIQEYPEKTRPKGQ
jgi:hypothetical protein